MKIVRDFKVQSRETLDYAELTRMLLQNIRSTCKTPLNGGIFLPQESVGEWNCQQAINHDLISIESQMSGLMDQVSGIAEYFSGYPGDIYRYSDMDILEQVYGAGVPFFLEGYHVLIYAAQCDNETLAVGIFMTNHPLTGSEAQGIAHLMDVYANQLGRTVKVHNRLKGWMDYCSPWYIFWSGADEDEEEIC